MTWLAGALHSNIYVADVLTGALTKITDFAETHVYDVVWSPRGEQLAFTAADAVWVQPSTPNTKPQQVSPAGAIARHPQWFVR